MAQKKEADQTQKPTPKRLRDARKEGDVAKSRDLTSTVLTLVWLGLMWMLMPWFAGQLIGLFDTTFRAVADPAQVSVSMLTGLALQVFLWLTIPLLGAAVLIGLLVEFLQAGPLFVPKRVQPKMSHLDPVEGVKRMFSMESLVELLKSVFKTAALIGILLWVLARLLDDYLELPYGNVTDVGTAMWSAIRWTGIWVVCVFAFVSVLDIVYQRQLFIRNLLMSRRDIRQESKDTEGDPLIKGKRRQLHQEWSQQNTLAAVRQASVVVTNPTHVAVALRYVPGETDLPVVTAKGEDYEAQLIREAAREAGVPIMENVPLARALNDQLSIDDYITPEFFEAVAEVLRWAGNLRDARLDR